MSDVAPTDLEMELRRNLTPCVCKHAYMQHDDAGRMNCLICMCTRFKEDF